MEKRGLGRGLSALMADVGVPGQSEAGPRPAESIVPVEQVVPNPDQPRRQFKEEDLEDLTNSIAKNGILQPLLVRRSPEDASQYQIVAGERRWRAAQRAQLHSVPIIIRDYSDAEMLEIAIVENVQRADLNPVEEAMGYRQLMDRFGHTQEKMAEALGKSRSHIANLLRLLQLPDEVLGFLRNGDLTAGHARALIPTSDPVALAKKVIAGGLSVRQTEKLAKAPEPGAPKAKEAQPWRQDKDADTRVLEQDLAGVLGMGVEIDHKPGGETGKLSVRYRSLEQLDTLCRLLSLNGADESR